MVPIAVAAYLVANVLAVPMWLRLSQRWGKLKAFKRSMIFNALAYLPLGLAVYQPLIDATTDLQRLGLACLAAMCIGVGANARNNLGESVAGDIIDDDHARTGERKEGVFFSFWMLAQKTAGGGVTLFSGFLLDAAGFVPNREQVRQPWSELGTTTSVVPGHRIWTPRLRSLAATDVRMQGGDHARFCRHAPLWHDLRGLALLALCARRGGSQRGAQSHRRQGRPRGGRERQRANEEAAAVTKGRQQRWRRRAGVALMNRGGQSAREIRDFSAFLMHP